MNHLVLIAVVILHAIGSIFKSMTKYVLNSGGIKRHPELKKQFHQELVKGLSSNPKFLLCNFAQGREYWEVKFQGYSNAIAEDMLKGIQPSFELATPADFAEQCKQADIIYIHGGDDHLLQYWMKQFDYKTLFKDKVVAGKPLSQSQDFPWSPLYCARLIRRLFMLRSRIHESITVWVRSLASVLANHTETLLQGPVS